MTNQKLDSYFKEVTKKYLTCGKAIPKKREKELRDRYYKTKYRLYSIDEKRFDKMMAEGFTFSDEDNSTQAKI